MMKKTKFLIQIVIRKKTLEEPYIKLYLIAIYAIKW